MTSTWRSADGRSHDTERDGQETIDYEAGSQVSLPPFGIVTIADEGFGTAVLTVVKYILSLAMPPERLHRLSLEEWKKDKLIPLWGWFAPFVSYSDQ